MSKDEIESKIQNLSQKAQSLAQAAQNQAQGGAQNAGKQNKDDDVIDAEVE